MKATHFVINKDECIAVIYQQSKRFGSVVVFRTNKINLEFPIETYNTDTNEKNEKDIIELILEVLPK